MLVVTQTLKGLEMKYFPLTLPQEIEKIGTLHLTGSRYFGTHRSNSDWDFIISTLHKEEYEELKMLFHKYNATLIGSYRIEKGGEVWRWHDEHDVQFDFQIIPDVKWKLKAQEWIKARIADGFCISTEKSKRDQMWKTAFEATKVFT